MKYGDDLKQEIFEYLDREKHNGNASSEKVAEKFGISNQSAIQYFLEYMQTRYPSAVKNLAFQLFTEEYEKLGVKFTAISSTSDLTKIQNIYPIALQRLQNEYSINSPNVIQYFVEWQQEQLKIEKLQKEVADFIIKEASRTGKIATVGEIAEKFNISSDEAEKCIVALTKNMMKK